MRFFLVLIISISSCVWAQPELQFPNACVSGEHLTIAAVGDVLLHAPLQTQGNHQGFDQLWEEATPYIRSADIAYANLEGPMAAGVTETGKEVKDPGPHFDNYVYTGFPLFNYPPIVASALKATGFSIVSTANNHALDRFAVGIDKTINALNQSGLAHAGTRLRGSNQDWVHISQKKNFKVAWIACTEHTNGKNDLHDQVLYCYGKRDKPWILNTIKALKTKVDAIIVTPHWGEEYESHPNADQKLFAHDVLEAGATAVIGSHPHVLQPLEKYMTHDGRATLIAYSLGNFVSYQGRPQTRNTIILFLGLTKTPQGTIINGVRFVPMQMQNRRGQNEINLEKTHANAMDHLLPQGNAIVSNTVITNPECQP